MTSLIKGGGGSAKRWCYSVSLFSKMGDKGKGGVKNFKKMGDVIYGCPLCRNQWLLDLSTRHNELFFSKSDDDMTENRHFVKW